MGENAINSFGFMGREGPCFHCGIEHTPLWRSGPPEKPVLCNACGSRWRTRGTLEDYFPKHANKDSYSHQSSKFLSRINLTSSSSTQRLEELPILESNIDVGHDQSLTDFGDGTIKGINSAPGVALSEQNIEGAFQHPPWVPNNVSKKKRSVLDQRVLSPTERLHQQLCHAMQEAEVSKESDDEDVLIYERINHYIPENEIGLGCMLLKPPSSPTKNSKP